MSTSPYRPDIDGLRAIAVGLVLVYHAFPQWCRGGFIGVDVFFVISGFLITGVIQRELAHGAFSFLHFYARRARRIFPALAVMLVAVFICGWLVLLPEEFEQLGKHIAGGAGFLSNFMLWKEAGYFDRAAEMKPLLHLWSLGIEEQFYVVWPLLLFAAWRLRVPRGLVLAGVLAGSLVINLSLAHRDLVADFFSPLSRAWELALGGLVATTGSTGSSSRWSWLSIAGLGAVAVAGTMITPATAFPGWAALLPAGGTAAIIAAGPEPWMNRALARRPLVAIGLISYPLYLWHWPLLSFGRILVGGGLSFGATLSLLFIAAVLAASTYIFIERPIRSRVPLARVAASASAVLVVMAVLGQYTFAREGFPGRVPQDGDSVRERHWSLKGPGVRDCGERVAAIKDSFCATVEAPTVVILGDSHAGDLFPGFLAASAAGSALRPAVVGAGTCWPTMQLEVRRGCDQVLNAGLAMIQDTPSVRFVVLGNAFDAIPRMRDPLIAGFFDGVGRTISAAHRMGKRVVFVSDQPALAVDPEGCRLRRPIQRMWSPLFWKATLCDGARPSDLRPRDSYDQFVDALEIGWPDVYFYDPVPRLCPQQVCQVFRDGRLLYGDWNHLSNAGSKYVVDDLTEQLLSSAPRPRRLRFGERRARENIERFNAVPLEQRRM